MTTTITAAGRASIRGTLEQLPAIDDPTVSAKHIAEAYVSALPSYLSDELIAEAFDAAQVIVEEIRLEREPGR